jgi:RNA polymerase sigma factor (sigma-70 family)
MAENELNEWITRNYEDLYNTTRNIVKHQKDADDLFQSVIEQLLSNKNFSELPPDRRKYFFIRTTKNNYYSKTSKYYYENKKHDDRQTDYNPEIHEQIEDPYLEPAELDWVHQQLKDLSWFERDLFLMWMEMGTLTQVSKKTTIPLNSVGRYINETKQKLIKLWVNRN